MQGKFGRQKLKDTNTLLKRGAVFCWKHKVLSNSPQWHLFLLLYPCWIPAECCASCGRCEQMQGGKLSMEFPKKRLQLIFSIVRITLKPRTDVFADLHVLFFQICWKFFAWHILRFLDFLFMIRICGQLPTVAQQIIWVFLLIALGDKFPLQKCYSCTLKYLFKSTVYKVTLFFPCDIFNPF